MKKLFFLIIIATVLAGCSTSRADYILTAYNSNGQDLGSRINLNGVRSFDADDAIKNFCRIHPRSYIRVTNPETGRDIDVLSRQEIGAEHRIQCP